MNTEHLIKLARLIRYYILTMTTQAGSGHPTSSLSAVELMTALLFGGVFRYNPDDPAFPNNDRLIFSKGHASPLFYALWGAAGCLSENELMTYRHFGSALEGHPTDAFRYTEAATGSLGQGLSIGMGMALNAKYLDRLPYRTYVLLGDSEMAEGSQWEAMELATHYQLGNLVGILDVNRLGQRGETMAGHDLAVYEQRVGAFGWETICIEGHSFEEILEAYQKAAGISGRPVMIIARTIKGKGVASLEGKNGWHGRALDKEACDQALKELEPIDKSVRGQIAKPENLRPEKRAVGPSGPVQYERGKSVATRLAYGTALNRISARFPELVSLDGEVCNSTRADLFRDAHPERFFEMFIAEQNMVGAALGLAKRGKIPFVSTFAAFLTRAFDQIRMSQYSSPNMKYVGSHAGVSIGEDGPSQMALEDLAMMRTILDGVVLYPSDAVSTEKLVEAAAEHQGIVYIRTTREGTPVLYGPDEVFRIGGCKVLRSSSQDCATVIGAGVTLHEALKAYEQLKKEGLFIRVIDLYSIKPLDEQTLHQAEKETDAVITVEDHYAEGGLGEAVLGVLTRTEVPVIQLAVRKRPKSGKPAELLDYEEISGAAIVKTVHTLMTARERRA
ncbi:MAG TPA: transketolase [Verrucomicrobia bacterium]|nr:MAG: transketolase [Lentisphaerae bacterium GWF2_57_35]HBA85255.1 transketolase [Verrucomicrobiota bacterium]